jgi:hypothetical protein
VILVWCRWMGDLGVVKDHRVTVPEIARIARRPPRAPGREETGEAETPVAPRGGPSTERTDPEATVNRPGPPPAGVGVRLATPLPGVGAACGADTTKLVLTCLALT